MIALALGLAAAPAFADIEARFVEGAPKDRFEITHVGDCPIGPSQVTIALQGSAAGLIFDTTGTGAGVEVFQPFVLVAGEDLLTGVPQVQDGDRSVVLALAGLAPGQTVAFTIDVDDTVSSRQITVSNSEITGAELLLTQDGQTLRAAFDASAQARIVQTACES